MSSTGDLVPDDFDLKAALRAKSSTPKEAMQRCPSCESVCLTTNWTYDGRTPSADKWRCTTCGETTDDPLLPECRTDEE